MSFLVSFNGQFTPHVYQVTPQQSLRPSSIQAVGGVKGKDHPQEFDEVLSESHRHLHSQGVNAYHKQQVLFQDKKKRIYAHDLMSSPLHTIYRVAHAQKAKEVMLQMGFRHLPVVDQAENLLGLLTDRDLLGALDNSVIETLMQKQVIVAQETTRIQEIAHLMLEEKLNALPIINDKHKLVGIITFSDILNFVIHLDEFKERA